MIGSVHPVILQADTNWAGPVRIQIYYRDRDCKIVWYFWRKKIVVHFFDNLKIFDHLAFDILIFALNLSLTVVFIFHSWSLVLLYNLFHFVVNLDSESDVYKKNPDPSQNFQNQNLNLNLREIWSVNRRIFESQI